MLFYEWIINELLPLFVPASALEMTLFHLNTHNETVTGAPVTVRDAIGMFLACVIGFVSVYAFVWVPFRGILHLIRWKRWRGY